jgi:transposase InsO family protein
MLLDNGLLVKVNKINKCKQKRADTIQYTELIVVPDFKQLQIIKYYHDSFGHLGISKVYGMITSKYFWCNAYKMTRNYILSCEVCQKNKRDYNARRTPLQPLAPLQIFSRWHIDILQLPKLTTGEEFSLVCIESFSGYIEGLILPDCKAITVSNVLISEVFARYGFPQILFSDLSRTFTGEIISNLCKLMRISKVNTSSHKPNANGKNEVANRCLINMLRTQVEDDKDWKSKLSCVLIGLRSSISMHSTNYSPFELMYSQSMRLEVQKDVLFDEDIDRDIYMKNLKDRVKVMRQVALDNIKLNQENVKRKYDDKFNVKTDSIQIGEKVWLKQILMSAGEGHNV